MSIEANLGFERVVQAATGCRECFKLGEVSEPDIDVAQPRPVGHRYWDRSFRVAILMINPGRSPKNSKTAKTFPGLIRRFRSGTMKLGELLDGQRERMERWGRPPGRFREFYGFVAYSDMDFHRANVAPSRAHDAAGNPTNVPYDK